ncbi:uncharacterized protein LOC130667953 [Microplitis mediator]|uniref:uncharacterized protein LOC130667953 n=1 Tax=Microplitis mediator TaxID=375433 RepID=UPI002553FBEE|nr:uncharacterized protein LOC130667953 [Microplitis mediator]
MQPLMATMSNLQDKCNLQQTSPGKKNPRVKETNFPIVANDRPGISVFNKSPDPRIHDGIVRSRVMLDRTQYIEQWLQTHKNIQRNTKTNSNCSSPSSVSSSVVYESPPQIKLSKKNQRSPLKDCNQLKRFKPNDNEKVRSNCRLHSSPVKLIKSKENQQVNNKVCLSPTADSPKKLSKPREKNIVDQYQDNLIIETCLSPINEIIDTCLSPINEIIDESPSIEIVDVNSPAPSSLFLESIHSAEYNSPQIDEIQSLSSPIIINQHIDEGDDSEHDDDIMNVTIHSDSNKTISDIVGNLDGSLINIDDIQSEHSHGKFDNSIDSDATFYSEVENANRTVIANEVIDCDDKSNGDDDERYIKVVIDDDDDGDGDKTFENELSISEVTSQSVTNINNTPVDNCGILNDDLSEREIVIEDKSVEEISQVSSQKISQDLTPPQALDRNNSIDTTDNIISTGTSPPSKQSSRVERCDTIINAVVKKKKKPKKGSLVERLQTLIARKISSIRIWRHQMSQDHLKTNSPCVIIQINKCIWQYSRFIISGKIINDDSNLIDKYVKENSLLPLDENISKCSINNDLNSSKSIKLLLVPEIVGKINFDNKNIIKIYPPWDIIDPKEVLLNIFYFIVTVDPNVTNDSHHNENDNFKSVEEFNCPCLTNKKLAANCSVKFSNSKPNFMQYLFSN